MKRFFCVAISFGVVISAVSTARSEWRAGVATVNITPQESMWMSGYGGRDHPSEGKLTDLWAKALVLDDGEHHVAVAVTLDLVGVDRGTAQAIRQRLHDKHGFEAADVSLFTSHTHTGPVVGSNLQAMYSIDDAQWALVEAYTERLIDQVVGAVGDAIENVEPVTLSWQTGNATFAVNRRNNREPDVPMLREQGLLKGPVDHDVPVLAIRAGKQLKAVLFGYACHATVLSFYQFSGDYPGFAMLELESRHPGAVAMFWAGCGADQNPLPRREVALAQEYGTRLADAVDHVLEQPMTEISGELSTSYAEINLGFAELPTREQLKTTAAGDNKFEVGRARKLLTEWNILGELREAYPYPVQIWQLGDGPQWVILGGEVVVDFSIRLKSELDPERTWVAGYANDVMAYIPSLRVLREGGYEGGGAMLYYGLPSAWNEEVEESIVGEVHRQASSTGN